MGKIKVKQMDDTVYSKKWWLVYCHGNNPDELMDVDELKR